MTKRIGILGGTFSPPHIGHLLLARYAIEEMALDEVQIMPCHIPPHKETTLPTEHRIEMLKLLFNDEPRTSFDYREINQDKISLTYLSMQEWRAERPNDQLFFIMGADSFDDFTNWDDWQNILDNCDLIIAKRNQTDLSLSMKKMSQAQIKKLHFLEKNIPTISSTQIRSNHQDIDFMDSVCPNGVAKYYSANCS